ncbi:MAG: hypothetical protein ACYTE6_09260, partial [Planctomycetota bacterium]
MPGPEGSIENILQSLQERAKELNCLYRVDEILSQRDAPVDDAYQQLIQALPPGWQYPDLCQAVLTVAGKRLAPDGFIETPWCQRADICVEGDPVGEVAVYYTEEKPSEIEGPFLNEERRLINAIAERIGFFIMQRRLQSLHESIREAIELPDAQESHPWAILLQFLERTDPRLLKQITRKMINHLCWAGIEAAQPLLRLSLERDQPDDDSVPNENRPLVRRQLREVAQLTQKTFQVASESLSQAEIVEYIQSWI